LVNIVVSICGDREFDRRDIGSPWSIAISESPQ
jgi:hypothetical protein